MRREVFREFTFGSLFNNYLQPYLSIFESNEKDKCQVFEKILETFKKSQNFKITKNVSNG